MTELIFGSSNRVALRVVPEVDWGVTPANPSFAALRFTQESLNYNATFTMSQEIRADRMTPDTIQTESSAGGDIKGELSAGTYDTLLTCAMFSDWVTTGTDLVAADISITKTPGVAPAPNTYKISTVAGDWTTHNLTVGQWVKVSGFAVAGTFFAQITSIAQHDLGIAPSKDVATEAAGANVTVHPLNFIRNGTTKKSVTVQKAFTDLAVPEYWNFTGVRVSKTTFELKTGSILGMTFTTLAKDAQMTQAQLGGATIAAANSNPVMNAVDNIAAIVFDGDPGGHQYYFNSLQLDLDNVLRGLKAVGNLGFVQVVPGSIKVAGVIELYFDSELLFNKFRNATAFSFSFVAQDSTGAVYIITVPRAKFTKMEIVAGGLDKDIFAKADLQGLMDSTGTYQFQISRG